MALCRCLEVHCWPRSKKEDYVAYVQPFGYPDTALVCGLCDNPGVIWLNHKERDAYEVGERIFKGAGSITRMRADDGGLHEGCAVGCMM